MAMEYEPQLRQDPITKMWYQIPVVDEVEEQEETPEIKDVKKPVKK